MVEPFLEGLSLQDAISMNKIYICDLVVLEGLNSFFVDISYRGGGIGVSGIPGLWIFLPEKTSRISEPERFAGRKWESGHVEEAMVEVLPACILWNIKLGLLTCNFNKID